MVGVVCGLQCVVWPLLVARGVGAGRRRWLYVGAVRRVALAAVLVVVVVRSVVVVVRSVAVVERRAALLVGRRAGLLLVVAGGARRAGAARLVDAADARRISPRTKTRWTRNWTSTWDVTRRSESVRSSTRSSTSTGRRTSKRACHVCMEAVLAPDLHSDVVAEAVYHIQHQPTAVQCKEVLRVRDLCEA